jgi:hypothetical protein
MEMMAKNLAGICMLLALITTETGPAIAGEFRPLDMPDQKYQSAPRTYQGQSADQNYDNTYRQFKADVNKKTPAERESLKNYFKAKRDEAIKKEQWQEVKYYTGLIDILGQ